MLFIKVEIDKIKELFYIQKRKAMIILFKKTKFTNS